MQVAVADVEIIKRAKVGNRFVVRFHTDDVKTTKLGATEEGTTETADNILL